MIHDFKGLVHTLAAIAAMLIGAVVFLRPKGGAAHRRLGYAFSACMGLLIATSFSIYRLTGGFNFLHVFSVLSTIGLAFGLSYAFRRRPEGRWMLAHYYWMSWSYIGLLAAFVAEISTRVAMPYVASHFGSKYLMGFWMVVGAATGVVVVAGRAVVNRNRPGSRAAPG